MAEVNNRLTCNFRRGQKSPSGKSRIADSVKVSFSRAVIGWNNPWDSAGCFLVVNLLRWRDFRFVSPRKVLVGKSVPWQFWKRKITHWRRNKSICFPLNKHESSKTNRYSQVFQRTESFEHIVGESRFILMRQTSKSQWLGGIQREVRKSLTPRQVI